MNEKRLQELFNNMLLYISEFVSKCDLFLTLKSIGFTAEEINELNIEIEE